MELPKNPAERAAKFAEIKAIRIESDGWILNPLRNIWIIPEKPGVYVFAFAEKRDLNAQLFKPLYVGQSACLRKRIRSHPMRLILANCFDHVYVFYRTRHWNSEIEIDAQTAPAAEFVWIQKYKPIFNIAGKEE